MPVTMAEGLVEVRWRTSSATAMLRRRQRDPARATCSSSVAFTEPLTGSMGVHFVNRTLAGDTIMTGPSRRRLTYEVRANGELALVGVEYVVFQEAWGAEHDQPPSLFGQTLRPRPQRQPVRHHDICALHALGLEGQPDQCVPGLEPQGAVHGRRGSPALTASNGCITATARGAEVDAGGR